MTLNQKLVILRKKSGITQGELAASLEVSRQSVHKWESGACYPEVPKLIKMKEIFGISIDDLLDDSVEIAMPEKKKSRRAAAPKTAEISEEAKEPILEAQEAPVSKNEEAVTVEYTVDVVENSASEEENEARTEAPVPEKTESIEETEKIDEKAETKKRGFFSRLFGRK